MQISRGAALAASRTVNDSVGSPTASPTVRGGSAEFGNAKRIAPLDFTKGILVLVMVLYHWLNYFMVGHSWVYKYLRFLPISFTFISGFLISQIYLSKYEKVNLKVPKRLLIRGLKLLVIVGFLNLVPRMIRLEVFSMRTSDWSLADFARDYFTGIHPIAFSVLVPIAYLLIISAGIFCIARYWENAYHIACLVLVFCAVACDAMGINSGYLQIASVGMLGVSVGHISINQINTALKHSGLIFCTYIAYLVAITLWNDSYVLQVVGVCVTLLVIYWCGTNIAERNTGNKIAILLGRYSLFSYIIQIVILQILRGSLHAFTVGIGVSLAALVACIVCTILSVVVLEFAKQRASTVNTLYKAVFS